MEQGCKICDKYKKHYYKDHVNGNGMEFYQLMDSDFSINLKIPKKFTDYCGILPATVGLKSPEGKIWSVGLQKTGGEILLQDGWKEFVEAHDILERDLLVFKYDGDSCFDISIFDERNCKKTPLISFMGCKPEKRERNEDFVEIWNVESSREVIVCSSSSSSDDNANFCQNLSIPKKFKDYSKTFPATVDSVEILDVKSRREVIVCSSSSSCDDDDIPITSLKNRVGSDYQNAESSYKRRITRRNSLFVPTNNKRHKPYVFSEDTKDNVKQESVHINRDQTLAPANFCMPRNKHLSLTKEQRKRVMQLVHSVHSNNPCFISVLSNANINVSYRMSIPPDFKKHLPSRCCEIILRVPGQQKRWSATLRFYFSDTRFIWRPFVRDNGLQVDDVCLFELMKNGKAKQIVLAVHILRA